MPTEKTKAEYRRLAAHFYEQRLGDEPPSPKRITDALKACAGEYRPGYWRRLRGALALDQEEKGYDKAAARIRETINPMTTDQHGPLDKGLRGAVPPKQRRAKSISKADQERLYGRFVELCGEAEGEALEGHQQTLSALALADNLGVRPAEMLGLQVDLEQGVVHVRGAKKTGGERGADRTLALPDDEGMRQHIASAVRVLQKAEAQKPGVMRRVQSRLDRISRQLWPRRQARPSLYTFRHQMGAELKSMKLDRRAIAYIMGHQSTQSVEVYGDRRKSRGGIGIKITGQEAGHFQGRENHRDAPEGMPDSRLPPSLRGAGKTPKTPVQQGQDRPQQPSTPPKAPKGPGM